MGDVVQFPNKDPYKIVVPQTPEEVDTNIENVHIYHISETIDSILPLIFNTLAASGFDLANNQDIKSGALLVESLRSFMCQFYNIQHPLQEVANELFREEDLGELGTGFILNDHININFKKTI